MITTVTTSLLLINLISGAAIPKTARNLDGTTSLEPKTKAKFELKNIEAESKTSEEANNSNDIHWAVKDQMLDTNWVKNSKPNTDFKQNDVRWAVKDQELDTNWVKNSKPTTVSKDNDVKWAVKDQELDTNWAVKLQKFKDMKNFNSKSDDMTEPDNAIKAQSDDVKWTAKNQDLDVHWAEKPKPNDVNWAVKNQDLDVHWAEKKRK